MTAVRVLFPCLYTEVDGFFDSLFLMEERQTQEALDFGEELVKSAISGKPIVPQSGFKCLAPEKRYASSMGKELRSRAEADAQEGNEILEKTELKEAFIEAQKLVTDSELPQNVIADVISLAFEYAVPVEGIESSGFGYRIHPISGELKFHYGTDFAANTGTYIRAFADGEIIAAGESESYGKYIIIEHGGGYKTMYAHCNELCMDCGSVKMGDVIATVGETGLATGPHLHFEIRYNDSYLNPEYYL